MSAWRFGGEPLEVGDEIRFAGKIRLPKDSPRSRAFIPAGSVGVVAELGERQVGFRFPTSGNPSRVLWFRRFRGERV